MMRVYKSFQNVIVDGNVKFCAATEECLDAIEGLPDGKGLLTALCRGRHTVTIKFTGVGKGNSTSGLQGGGHRPRLLQALCIGDGPGFSSSLRTALENARRNNMPVEHVAKQLTLGLSPVTYNRSSQNVVAPNAVSISWFQRHFVGVKTVVDRRVEANLQTLLKLGTGDIPLRRLPRGWANHLPRLLRPFLTPGPGLSPIVNFHPTKTFHCVLDPAMHQRPPAIGLAHELIHALHCVTGVTQGANSIDGQNLEEIITTGFPPYQYEEFSDNKLRTQWPTHLHLRKHY
jgi:hypothetical protein